MLCEGLREVHGARGARVACGARGCVWCMVRVVRGVARRLRVVQGARGTRVCVWFEARACGACGATGCVWCEGMSVCVG